MNTLSALDKIRAKVFADRHALKRELDQHHSGRTTVLTNGCFDLIHRGHILTLTGARSQGDLLIVALNTDESVRKLKGPARPVTSQEDRAFVMAALACVDYVTFFGEETPVETIRILAPRVHVKGGDYKPEDLPEREIVLSLGGRLVVLPFEQGYSTTAILEKSK